MTVDTFTAFAVTRARVGESWTVVLARGTKLASRAEPAFNARKVTSVPASRVGALADSTQGRGNALAVLRSTARPRRLCEIRRASLITLRAGVGSVANVAIRAVPYSSCGFVREATARRDSKSHQTGTSSSAGVRRTPRAVQLAVQTRFAANALTNSRPGHSLIARSLGEATTQRARKTRAFSEAVRAKVAWSARLTG